MSKLSSSSEPVLAILNTLAGIAGTAASVGATNEAVVPQGATAALSGSAVLSLALGWAIRRYTSPGGAHRASADYAAVKAELKAVEADPVAEVPKLAADALKAAEAIYPAEIATA